MKNNIEEFKQMLEELYRTQQARLDVGADDLDIREEIAEVEEEIKELQDDINIDRENSIKNERSSIEEDINKCNKLTASWIGLSNQLALKRVLSDYKRVLKEKNRLEEQVEYDKTHIYTPQTIELNFISKSKIEDKIKEIDKKIKYEENEKVVIYLHKQKNILQELLESEE